MLPGLDILAQHSAFLSDQILMGRAARYPVGGYLMKKTTAAIPFAGFELDQTRHVCAFFNNAEEEYRVLLPFIKDGFKCGHRAIHVVNPDQRENHVQRLSEAGIDAAGAEQRGATGASH